MNQTSAASPFIDVRSDTVTRPCDQMRAAMHTAEVGDDVYGDDPTVNALQNLAAEQLGQEAALFMPSGTQSNLVAFLAHCQRGDEYIVGGEAHTYKYEGGGAAVLGGIQPQTVPFGPNGELPLDLVEAVIKPDDFHFARTKLLSLENTQHGRVQSMEYMQSARAFAEEKNLILHLDGARMVNAAVALNVPLRDIGSLFHSVSLCLSKGLGAPMGSILAGNTEFIQSAKRWRKVTGGGLRQSGVVAAAGIYALEHCHEWIPADHEHAKLLATLCRDIPGVSVRNDWVQTNMVWLDFDGDHQLALPAYTKERGVLMSVGRNAGRVIVHRNIGKDDVARVAQVIRDYFESR